MSRSVFFPLFGQTNQGGSKFFFYYHRFEYAIVVCNQVSASETRWRDGCLSDVGMCAKMLVDMGMAGKNTQITKGAYIFSFFKCDP